jgi:hypothetical protein
LGAIYGRKMGTGVESGNREMREYGGPHEFMDIVMEITNESKIRRDEVI